MKPTLGGRTPFLAISESERRAMHNLGENSVVAQYRCLECDQIEEFQELVIEHEQLLAEHRRLQSAPFSASEHTEHRRRIAAQAPVQHRATAVRQCGVAAPDAVASSSGRDPHALHSGR